MAYYCVSRGVYYNPDKNLGYKLPLFPYIANYIFTCIVLSPFYKFNAISIDWNQDLLNKKIVNILMPISIFVFTSYGLLKLGDAILANQIGFSEIYNSGHEDGVNLLAHTNPILALLNNWGGAYYSVIRSLIVTIIMSRLIQSKWKSKKMYFCLLISFFPDLASCISAANRGGIFFLMVDMLFFFFIVNRTMPSKIRNRILGIGLSSVLLMIFFSIAISNDRFVSNGVNETSFDATSRYFGEPMANLGDMYYGKVKHHLMGETFFPEFSDAPNFKSLGDFFYYWSKRIGVPIDYMGTLFGDCYIQFKTVGAFIFIIIIVFIWRHFFISYKINTIPLTQYYFRIFAVGGLFGYGFYDKNVHLFFLFLVFMCYGIKNKEKSLHNSL